MNQNEILVKRGEVWLIRYQKAESVGTEIYSKNSQRPALIISRDWQNEKNNRVIAVPLSRTLQPFYEGWEIKVRINNQDGKIMCDQIRNFDKKKRLIRKVGVMPEKIIKEVEKKLQELIINYD